MPRKVVGGLIQAAAPLMDPATPTDTIRKAAIDAHIALIDEVRRVWPFYRDRRPDSYGPMAEQVP